MPPRRAPPPRRVPLHLPVLTGRGSPPHREVAGTAFTLHHFDARALALAFAVEASELSVVVVLGSVEVQPGRERIAPAALVEDRGELDHLRYVVRRLAPDVGFENSKPLDVLFERPGVVLGDLPGVPTLAASREFELVVTLIGVRGEVTDVGDVEDVANVEALP